MTPTSHDLIWPSQLQVRRERLFPEGAIHPNQPNEWLNRDGAWRLLRPYDLLGVQHPTANTPVNQQQLAENEESVESLQIVEYLQDVPGVGRRDFRRYPPHYGDPLYRRGAGRGRGNHPDRRPPPFQDQPPPDPPAGRGRGRMDSPTVYMSRMHTIFKSIEATHGGARTDRGKKTPEENKNFKPWNWQKMGLLSP